MAQVTVYVPDTTLETARRNAARAHQSLSAYIAELLNREAHIDTWPPSLKQVLDHGQGSLQEPPDPPPEDIDVLEP